MEEYCTYCRQIGLIPVSEKILAELDDTICEILSGNQGSFKPHHGTVTMAEIALELVRTVYPLSERP